MKRLMENWRKHLNEEKQKKAYRITFNDKINIDVVKDIQLEVLGVGEKIVDKSKEGFAEISATPNAVKGIVEYFKEKSLPLELFTNDKGNPVAK